MDGWVKVYRKMLENPVVWKTPEHVAVWVWLLLNATHNERATLFGGKKIVLKPGQLIAGRKKIAAATNVNESKVYRILEDLKSEQQIEQQVNSHGSLISIVAWNEYQKSEQPSEQQVNSHRTLYKNDKNEKESFLKKQEDPEPVDNSQEELTGMDLVRWRRKNTQRIIEGIKGGKQ